MGPLCSLTVSSLWWQGVPEGGRGGGRETEWWLVQASRCELVVLVVPRGEEGSRFGVRPAPTIKPQNHKPNERLLVYAINHNAKAN